MAAVYVAEYQSVRVGGPAVDTPPITEQVVGITPSHTESLAFSDNTQFLRVHTDAVCSVLIANTPIATTSNMRLAANQTEYFNVKPGQKISVIQNV